MTLCFSCPIFDVVPPCQIMQEDTTRPFPQCCPQVACPWDIQRIIPVLPEIPQQWHKLNYVDLKIQILKFEDDINMHMKFQK